MLGGIEMQVSQLAAHQAESHDVSVLTTTLPADGRPGRSREAHGAVDVYVFQSDKGEWMAPALKAVFPAVDVQNRVIRVVREKLDEVAVYNE